MSPRQTSQRTSTRRAKIWAYSVGQFRGGINRVKGAAIPSFQAAICATIAWGFCRLIMPAEPNPIFAPIATLICMGFSRNRQPQKVIEIGLGATTGVIFGGLVGHFFGFGWIQLLLLLVTTTLVGRFIHRSDFVAFQTAINAIVVASMVLVSPESGDVMNPFYRGTNALIGAGVALIATILIPSNVVSRPRRYTAFIAEELSRIIRQLSIALDKGNGTDIAQLAGRLKAARELMNDAQVALSSAQETAAISPSSRSSLPILAELDRLITLEERIHITTSLLQRQSRNMVTEVGSMPELSKLTWQTADLLEEISDGIAAWKRPIEARDKAIFLASHLSPEQFVDHNDWRSSALITLMRSIVVDLLQCTGLSHAQARAVLADTGDYDPHKADLDTEADLPSALWGTERFLSVDDSSAEEK